MKKGSFNLFIVVFLVPIIFLGYQVVRQYQNFRIETEAQEKDSYNLEAFLYTEDGIIALVESEKNHSLLGFRTDFLGDNRSSIDIPATNSPYILTSDLRLIHQGDKNILLMDDLINDDIGVYSSSLNSGFEKLDVPFLFGHFIDHDNIDWQGNFVVIGKDLDSNPALLHLSGGVPTVISLSNIPQIGNNAKYISLEDDGSQDNQVPFIKVTLYDDTKVFLGLWLENGKPVVAAASNADEAVLELALKYYGSDTVLTNLKNTHEGGAYVLTQHTWGGVDEVRSGLPLIPTEEIKIVPNMTLFNPHLIYLSKDQTLVFSSKDANPVSGFTGYVFDSNGEIETTFSSVLDCIDPAYFSDRNEIHLFGDMLFIKNKYEPTGFAIDLKVETVSPLSKEVVEKWEEPDLGADFEPPSPKWKQFASSRSGFATLLNLAIWVIVYLIMVIIFTNFGKKERKIIAKGIKIPATILKVERTGTRINNDYLVKLHLSLVYEGEEKSVIAKHLVSPVNPVPIGGIVNVAYDPKTNMAAILNDNEAANMPSQADSQEFAFVTIEKIQKTPYQIENATIAVIEFALNGKKISLPVPENSIYRYTVGELIEVTHPKYDMENILLASRSAQYQGKRVEFIKSILGDRISFSAIATSLEDCNVTLYDKKLLKLTTTTDQNGKKLVLKNLLFVPATMQVINGMPVNSSMERSLFAQKMQLQNMQQGTGTVISIVSKEASYSNNPMIYAKVQLQDTADVYIAEEPLSSHEIPEIGQTVWIGYDSTGKKATIIDTV